MLAASSGRCCRGGPVLVPESRNLATDLLTGEVMVEHGSLDKHFAVAVYRRWEGSDGSNECASRAAYCIYIVLSFTH